MAFTNTTSTMGKPSLILGPKCDETQNDMDLLLANLNAQDAQIYRVYILPNVGSPKDDVLTAGVNGTKFYFRYDSEVLMPDFVYKQLCNCGERMNLLEKIEKPVTAEPKSEEPKNEEPKNEAPKDEEPKGEAPKRNKK